MKWADTNKQKAHTHTHTNKEDGGKLRTRICSASECFMPKPSPAVAKGRKRVVCGVFKAV